MPLFVRRGQGRDGAYAPPWSYYSFRPDTYFHGFSWYAEHIDLIKGIRMPRVYRSMFLTQPPVTTVMITPGQFTLYDKEGITLGLIAVSQVMCEFRLSTHRDTDVQTFE